MSHFEALYPCATWPAVTRIRLAPRLDDLNGKTVYIVKSWVGSGFDDTAEHLADALTAVGATPVIRALSVRYSQSDTALWAEMDDKAVDGFIYLAASSSSTTSYAYKWSTLLEQSGRPGVVGQFSQMAEVRATTVAREGAEVRGVAYSFPTSAMEPQAYKAAIAETLAALTTPLTAQEIQTGTVTPPPDPEIAASGDLETIQRVFYGNNYTDGLPIIPPTANRVAAMLKGTSHAADEVVSTEFFPEGLQVTIRQVAINAVMAGCLPAHLPVLLATIEAYQSFHLMNSQLRSTNSFAFMQMVNGPIAQELNMNASHNALGPGNQANSTMGRALRLFIINLGRGVPGENVFAVQGNPAANTFMFAENEADSPWAPLSVDQGFDASDSTLSFFSGGWSHMGNYMVGVPFDRVIKDIARFEHKYGATLIISPKRAQDLADQGLSKADIIDHVWSNATAPLGWNRTDSYFFEEADEMKDLDPATEVAVFPKGRIRIVVTGGDAGPMMQAWDMTHMATVSIDKWR